MTKKIYTLDEITNIITNKGLEIEGIKYTENPLKITNIPQVYTNGIVTVIKLKEYNFMIPPYVNSKGGIMDYKYMMENIKESKTWQLSVDKAIKSGYSIYVPVNTEDEVGKKIDNFYTALSKAFEIKNEKKIVLNDIIHYLLNDHNDKKNHPKFNKDTTIISKYIKNHINKQTKTNEVYGKMFYFQFNLTYKKLADDKFIPYINNKGILKVDNVDKIYDSIIKEGNINSYIDEYSKKNKSPYEELFNNSDEREVVWENLLKYLNKTRSRVTLFCKIEKLQLACVSSVLYIKPIIKVVTLFVEYHPYSSISYDFLGKINLNTNVDNNKGLEIEKQTIKNNDKFKNDEKNKKIKPKNNVKNILNSKKVSKKEKVKKESNKKESVKTKKEPVKTKKENTKKESVKTKKENTKKESIKKQEVVDESVLNESEEEDLDLGTINEEDENKDNEEDNEENNEEDNEDEDLEE